MAIPLWKVRREFLRLWGQLHDLPVDIKNYWFATRTYDQTFADQIKRFDGALPPGPRIAILVIYPATGLTASHLRTLDYLHERNYAPLVVSNLPLSEKERGELRKNCWIWLERPNFGYDFGGYRDGVLTIADRLTGLERLVLLNDSIWFPLPGARDWLSDADALGTDLAGASAHFGVPRPEIEDFRSIDWTYAPNRRNFHYGSFALLFRSPILRDPGFLTYWRRLRLADKKKQTVRRGEMGLTQWVISHGYTHGATLDITTLDQDLQSLDSEQLLHIARNLVIPELPRLLAIVKQVTSEANPRREDLVKLILLAVARQGASYALAAYSIPFRGFPFLKKSPVWLSEESAAITLKILGGIEGAESLTEEARQLAEAKKRKTRSGSGTLGAPDAVDLPSALEKTQPVAMIIDDRWPEPDRDSGSVDAINMVQSMKALGYYVVFGVVPMFEQVSHYREALRSAGVHTVCDGGSAGLRAFLRRHGRSIDVFVLNRVGAGGTLFELVRRRNPEARILFNTVDLHHVREFRAAEHSKNDSALRRAGQTRDREFHLARNADLTLVVSTAEKELLETAVPGCHVSVLPLARRITPPTLSFEKRAGIGFIGGFAHAPNLDAVRYFLEEVWPLVRRRDHDASFEIVGSGLPDGLIHQVEGDVRYLGLLENIDDWLDHLKVSVAPLRFGAGAKGKVASSLCAGLPCVLTSVAAEGMGLEDSVGVILADTREAMAESLLRLCADPDLWQRTSQAGLGFAREHLSIEAYERALKGALVQAGALLPK